jgi:hypothetical protein
MTLVDVYLMQKECLIAQMLLFQDIYHIKIRNLSIEVYDFVHNNPKIEHFSHLCENGQLSKLMTINSLFLLA